MARVAVVTGAGSGIGRAVALDLCAAGLRCVAVGRRRAPLEETAALASGPVLAVTADVTVAADRARAVAETLAAFGRLDVLVNNAGVSALAPLLAQREEEWRRVMALNLDAAFFTAQAALPALREGGAGRIVNVGSVFGSLALNAALYDAFPEGGPHGPVRQPAYHAAKGGLLNLTRDLAAAVAPWGVTVNCVSPGMVLTDQTRELLAEEVKGRLARMTPMGRLGAPAEIAAAVRFLASEGASFVTGAELVVDGGWSLW